MLNIANASLSLVVCYLLLVTPLYAEKNSCMDCHHGSASALNAQHQSAQMGCTVCHRGDALSADKELAHRGMFVAPGDLSNASQACGSCHVTHVQGVLNSQMHTGLDVVRKTRRILEPDKAFADPHSFQNLGQGIADSLLRKQCASCHLGQQRDKTNSDPVTARGGGCLACHLHKSPKDQHPQLTAKVDDAHCFGCHSRSGRISLNYAGLAETDVNNSTQLDGNLYRLSDGRLVQKKTADSHHESGMACIDCHTGPGLMNLNAEITGSGIDIQCNDCHANTYPRISVGNWPDQYRSMLAKVPFSVNENQLFLTTEKGIPLWHIEVKGDAVTLYPKLGGKSIVIPQVDVQHRPLSQEHLKLTCQTCHSAWVPQCLGCHIEYDPKQEQWDHASRLVTPGRWLEHRWDVATSVPTLGWKEQHQIDVFMPGMIMSMEHPNLTQKKFLRRFASIAPHTTGASRQCHECHQSSQMLGLGKGQIKTEQEELVFESHAKPAMDGLPADAWTTLYPEDNQTDVAYPRPFSSEEISDLYRADEKNRQH